MNRFLYTLTLLVVLVTTLGGSSLADGGGQPLCDPSGGTGCRTPKTTLASNPR